MTKTKKIIYSIIGGIIIGFVIGFIAISIWFFNTDVNSITKSNIDLLGLQIMSVQNVNGEIVKSVNNLSMTIIGVVCSLIIYTILSFRGEKQ